MHSSTQSRLGTVARLSLAVATVIGHHAHGQTITIGAEDDAAPWSYPDGTGYVNDVVKAAFRAVGWTVEQKVLPYARCKSEAAKGAIAGCFAVGRRPDMETAFLFPNEPVVAAANLLVARSDSKLEGCDPHGWPRGVVIGFVRSYEYVDAVENLIAASSPRAVKADIANSELGNLRKVHAGRIEAAILNVDGVKQLDYVAKLARVDNRFRIVCNFGTLPVYAAFSRAHPQGKSAVEAFNRGFGMLRKRGELDAMQVTWRIKALDKITVVKQ